MQGPARVGKTSVKCLILSQLYDSIVSTGIADRPQVAVGQVLMQQFVKDPQVTVGEQQVRQHEEKKWKLVTDDNIVEMFANDVKSLIGNDDPRMKTLHTEVLNSDKKKWDHSFAITNQDQQDNIAQFNQEQYSRNAEVAQDKSDELPVTATPNITSSTTDIHPVSKHEPGLQSSEESGNHATTSDTPTEVTQTSSTAGESNTATKLLSEILSVVSNRDDKLTLYKDWLYFIDSGGQIQFQQILQAFIPCASILMLVISLADSLSSQSSTELQCKDGKYIVSEHSLTIQTLLKRLISMVNFSNQQEDMTSNDTRLATVIKPPNKLKVITIATYQDKYDECIQNKEIIETIEDKEAQLKQIFQSVKGNLSYENPVSGEILSKLDGSKARYPEEEHDDNLKKVIKDIRAELSNQAFTVEIPLSWYAYEILLRHKAHNSCGVLPLNECISSGIDLGLEVEEINIALKLFYLLNSILYYPETVSKLVFIDPYSLIQVVNELMVLICKIRNEVYVGRGDFSLPEMANFGIITIEVFSHKELKMFAQISATFYDFKDHILNIFEHLLLAKKLSENNGKYFMPALLPLTDPLKAVTFSSSGSTPLLFHFKNGAPVGFFCAMIVNLLSSEDYLTNDEDDEGLFKDFLWELDTKVTTKMYSNAIILRNNNLQGRVHFVESSDWFEIHCEYREDQAEVKEAIQNAIKETKKKRKIGKEMKLDIAFFCPCGRQPQGHLAILKRNTELSCQLFHCHVDDTNTFPRMSWIILKSNPGMCFDILNILCYHCLQVKDQNSVILCNY